MIWLPLPHLEPRLEDRPARARLVQTLFSLAMALAVGAVFLRLAGLDPLAAYGHILRAGFLGKHALSDTAVKATPILLSGLGVALAFRMRLWNIGAEGQLQLGAWAAAGVALGWLPPSTPPVAMLAAMMLAGMLAGAAWGGIPGVLRARLGVSEIITTLMMNYIAQQWVCYFVFGRWSERGFQLTPQFPPAAWLPRLSDLAGSVPGWAGMTVHLGLVLGVLAAALLWLLLRRSRLGYEICVAGANPAAARYAGIPVARHTVVLMLLSGALAGLAGVCEVAGVVHRLQDRFSPGYGFTAIIVAWLARLSPWGVVLVALLFGGLLVGGKQIQPAGIPQMLEGLILFVVVGTEVLERYRVRWQWPARPGPTAPSAAGGAGPSGAGAASVGSLSAGSLSAGPSSAGSTSGGLAR